MPGFDLVVSSPTAAWIDPPSLTAPTRIRPRAGRPLRRYRTLFTGAAPPPGPIVISARIGGVVVPDAGLGGLLFGIWWLEWPGGPAPIWSLVAPGVSAEQQFTLPLAGHYVFGVWRPTQGAILVHLDAD